jgi:hypothetical protein
MWWIWWLIGKDLEGNDNGTIELWSLHMLGGTEEETRDLSFYVCMFRPTFQPKTSWRKVSCVHTIAACSVLIISLLFCAVRCKLRTVPVYTQTTTAKSCLKFCDVLTHEAPHFLHLTYAMCFLPQCFVRLFNGTLFMPLIPMSYISLLRSNVPTAKFLIKIFSEFSTYLQCPGVGGR